MASTAVFTCVCGIQKKTSNHWILAMVEPGCVRFVPWEEKLARREDVIVLCGEGCAAALLSRSLGEWKAPRVGRARVKDAALAAA